MPSTAPAGPPPYPTLTPFVGRAGEVAVLHAALARTLAGRGALVLIAGDAGMGKTRLTEEFARYAEAQGAHVLFGRCYEGAGAPAYWPWLQILRAYLRDIDDATLQRELGAGAPFVAQLLPELYVRLPDLPEPPPLEPSAARFHLFDALTGFLTAAARRRPLLIVLDDLHWADAASLLWLHFLTQAVRDQPLLLLGAYRDAEITAHHSLTDVLVELTRELHTERLALDGLSQVDVGRFVEHLAGGRVSDRLAAALRAETGGNPFFLGEVVRMLTADGELTDDLQAPLRHIPDSVREVIRRRLSRLSPSCVELLSVASVIGRTFSSRLLASVTRAQVGETLDQLDAAVTARIVEVRGPPGQYQFAHALIQETLYSGLGTARRMRLHLEIGAALEQQYRSDPAPHFAELAFHYGQAAPLGAVGKAVDFALRAAERAMAQAAWESAVGHYQQALQAFDLLAEPADPAHYCETLLALGEAQNRAAAGRSVELMRLGAGGSPDARETFLRAARFAQDAEMAELLARATLGLSGFNPYANQGGVEGLQLMDHALTMLPEAPTPLRARLLARAGLDRYVMIVNGKLPYTRRSDDLIRFQTAQAVVFARHLNDPTTLGYALLMQGMLDEIHPLTERLSAVDEVIELAERSHDRSLLVWGLHLKTTVLERSGAVDEARPLLAEMEVVAEDLRVPYFIWLVRIHHAAAALRAGDFPETERWIGLAADIQPHSGVSVLMLIAIRREQRRMDELLPLLDSVIEMGPRAPDAITYRILCQLEAGDTLAARAAFPSTVVELIRFPVTPLRVLTLLAECCVMLDDVEHALMLYERLVPFAAQNVVCPSTDLIGGAVDYYLGLLATIVNDWKAAHEHFSEAVRLNDAWGLRVYAGHARYAWAEMLWKRGGSTNADTVLRLLGEARTLADAVGSVRLGELVAGLTERVRRASTPPARLGMLLRLSRREREVLALIIEGQSDREIADRLYISPRTVTTHVTHILNKLGANSRVEAAELASNNGHFAD